MRIIISGGPGAGCTSTAIRLGSATGLRVLDSDTFFHKPTDPPYQEQYSPEERRELVKAALGETADWILSGSISSWEVEELPGDLLGVFLDIPTEERMRRLLVRERERFGHRIDPGGDMHEENRLFLAWAADYEMRTGPGRNRETDREFLFRRCERVLEIDESVGMDEVMARVRTFVG